MAADASNYLIHASLLIALVRECRILLGLKDSNWVGSKFSKDGPVLFQSLYKVYLLLSACFLSILVICHIISILL
jgi:hypothetical protein